MQENKIIYLDPIERAIKLEIKTQKISDDDLLNVAGGKMDNKFIAKSLLGLTLFTGMTAGLVPNSTTYATNNNNVSASLSLKEIKPAENFEKTANAFQNFTKKQAIEDINYVLEAVSQYHVSCVNGLPKEVLKQKEIEVQNMPEEITTLKLWQAISRILNKMHDAHTSVGKPSFSSLKRLPFEVESKGNNFICTNDKFKGSKILSINGITIANLYEKHKSQCSYEIEEWAYNYFFDYSVNFIDSRKLECLDIDTSKLIEIKFETKDGTKSENFNLVEIEDSHLEKKSLVSYKIDKEKNVAIFTLDECHVNDFYKETVDRFFEEVSQNNISNIIVDVRENLGGESETINYFAMYMKNINKVKWFGCDSRKSEENRPIIELDATDYKMDKNLFDGNVYVATSNSTFSTGVWFTILFSDNNLGTIVGEIPGNSPTCYGDAPCFQTPNSKLAFQSSTKRWYRPDSSKNPERLVPDVQVRAKDAINRIYEIIDEKENFTEFETEHFKVIYPKTEENKARELSEQLAANFDRITKKLGVTLDEKTSVKLFANKDSFHKSIGCYGHSEYDWITGTADNGLIKARLDIEINHLKQVIVHEFTHIATQKLNSGHIPFVLFEGIATFEAGQENLKQSLKFLGSKQLPTTPEWLFSKQHLSQMPANMQYAFAYSFTEFIVKNYGYEKVVELLKTNYQNNEFDFKDIQEIYEKWSDEVKHEFSEK